MFLLSDCCITVECHHRVYQTVSFGNFKVQILFIEHSDFWMSFIDISFLIRVPMWYALNFTTPNRCKKEIKFFIFMSGITWKCNVICQFLIRFQALNCFPQWQSSQSMKLTTCLTECWYYIHSHSGFHCMVLIHWDYLYLFHLSTIHSLILATNSVTDFMVWGLPWTVVSHSLEQEIYCYTTQKFITVIVIFLH
jgi:hypothetical protein